MSDLAQTLRETWDSLPTAPKWTAQPSQGTVDVSIDAGALKLLAADNGFSQYLWASQPYTFVGSYYRARLQTEGDTPVWLFGLLAGNGNLYLYVSCDHQVITIFAGTAHAVTLPYDPVAHEWVQLRETGGDVVFETAPDASGRPGTYTVRATWPGAAPSADLALILGGGGRFYRADAARWLDVGSDAAAGPLAGSTTVRMFARRATGDVIANRPVTYRSSLPGVVLLNGVSMCRTAGPVAVTSRYVAVDTPVTITGQDGRITQTVTLTLVAPGA